MSALCVGGVISLKTSIKGVELVQLRGGNVHSSWFIPFKACHMLLGLLLLKCSSTLFLYCRLAALTVLLRS